MILLFLLLVVVLLISYFAPANGHSNIAMTLLFELILYPGGNHHQDTHSHLNIFLPSRFVIDGKYSSVIKLVPCETQYYEL